jgi:hypothetical protein
VSRRRRFKTCWQIVDDTLGVYTRAETLVHWSGAGVPGIFEVVVPDPPQAFADAPYDLHLPLFTSYGVRQFNVPAPPATPKLPSREHDRIAETAAIISECYAISILFSQIKALQVFWRPDPPPDARAAQHWLLQISGIHQQESIRAWDAERGTLLAEFGRGATISPSSRWSSTATRCGCCR